MDAIDDSDRPSLKRFADLTQAQRQWTEQRLGYGHTFEDSLAVGSEL